VTFNLQWRFFCFLMLSTNWGLVSLIFLVFYTPFILLIVNGDFISFITKWKGGIVNFKFVMNLSIFSSVFFSFVNFFVGGSDGVLLLSFIITIILLLYIEQDIKSKV
jgi:hypothetical protein